MTFSHGYDGAMSSAIANRCPALEVLTQCNAWSYIVKSHRGVTGQGKGADGSAALLPRHANAD